MSTGAILQNQVIQKAWRDPSFKSKLISNPKAAIQEALGITLPDHVNIRTVEENSNELILVIPPNPSKVVKSDTTPAGGWDM